MLILLNSLHMFSKKFALIIGLCCCGASLFATESIQEKFDHAEQEFLVRWEAFGGNSKEFNQWSPEWRNEPIRARFKSLWDERLVVYFSNPEDLGKTDRELVRNQGFETPESWTTWHSRYPYPTACEYNLAIPEYNATIVKLRNSSFLAMEAPTEENLETFLHLLDTFEVTHLARLTPAQENKRDNCFPYWEGRTHLHPKTARPILVTNAREIEYFATDLWKDHHGVEAERLLSLIEALRTSAAMTSNPIIAIHCRAGVGRTGTLMAGHILLEDIDRQLASGKTGDEIEISIDRVIWELSLQRPFSVTHFDQYRTLYQLVDLYLSKL